jgi:hypothetical protein
LGWIKRRGAAAARVLPVLRCQARRGAGGRELRTVVDVCLDEVALLVWSRVAGCRAGVRVDRVVVVVAPFCKVIGKVESGRVGSCVFKVNDDELLVLVGGLEER